MPSTTIEELIEPHRRLLQQLADASDRRTQTIARNLTAKETKFIGDIAYNLLRGRFQLSDKEKDYFKQRKRALKCVGDPTCNKAKVRRNNLRKRGGSLSRDLSQLLLRAAKCPRDHLKQVRQKKEEE